MIAQVIAWKFSNQEGMATSEGKITAFPGGIPTKKEQDKWVAEHKAYLIDKEKPTEKQKADSLKMSGVIFEGVMCSAEAEDMWGLASIKDFITAGASTPFVFNNGNTLVLTPDNYQAFQAVWVPFRLGFFK